MLDEISDHFEQDYANGFQDILDQQNTALIIAVAGAALI